MCDNHSQFSKLQDFVKHWAVAHHYQQVVYACLQCSTEKNNKTNMQLHTRGTGHPWCGAVRIRKLEDPEMLWARHGLAFPHNFVPLLYTLMEDMLCQHSSFNGGPEESWLTMTMTDHVHSNGFPPKVHFITGCQCQTIQPRTQSLNRFGRQVTKDSASGAGATKRGVLTVTLVQPAQDERVTSALVLQPADAENIEPIQHDKSAMDTRNFHCNAGETDCRKNRHHHRRHRSHRRKSSRRNRKSPCVEPMLEVPQVRTPCVETSQEAPQTSNPRKRSWHRAGRPQRRQSLKTFRAAEILQQSVDAFLDTDFVGPDWVLDTVMARAEAVKRAISIKQS
jgi:hypothetical protein